MRILVQFSARICQGALFAVFVAGLTPVPALRAGTVSNWVGGTNNSWTDLSNWDNGVPMNAGGTTFAAAIDTTTNNPVMLGSSLAVTSISLGSANSLQIADGSTLTLAGGLLENNGSITGALTLAGPAIASVGPGSSLSGALTNGAQSTINILNGGLSTTTTINGLTNQTGGVLQVQTGGLLLLTGAVVNQTGAQFQVENGSVLRLDRSQTYTNNGLISVAGVFDTNQSTLDGTGTVSLNGGTLAGKFFFTSNAGQTITGTGGVNAALMNHGTVTATGGTLTFGGGSQIDNDGLVQATSTGTLNLTFVTNTGGSVVADGGIINQSQALSGGTVTTKNGGIFNLTNFSSVQSTFNNGGTAQETDGGSASLSGAINQSGGVIQSSGGSNLTLGTSTTNQSGGLIQTVGASTITLNGAFDNQAGGQILIGSGGTLELQRSMTVNNNGLISVQGGTFDTNQSTFNGTGTISLANASLAGKFFFTSNAGQTISGNGSVNAALMNHGTVTATGGTLTFGGGSQIDNDGLVQANSTGTLNLTFVTNTGGTLFANGGTINQSQALTGGSLIIGQGGAYNLSSAAASPDTLTNNGAITLQNVFTTASLNLHAGGTYTNNGSITLGNNTVFASSLNGNTAVALNGSGTLTVAGGQITGTSDVDFTNGAGHTIVGNGLIGNFNSYTNQGAVSSSGGDLFLESGTLTNNGTLQAGTGRLFAYGTLTNYNAGTLTGGTYDATSGLYINAGDIFTNDANIVLRGTGTLLDVHNGNPLLEGLNTNGADASFSLEDGALFAAQSFNNAGAVVVGAGSVFGFGGNYTQTAGSTRVDGTLRLNSRDGISALLLEGGKLWGSGSVNGDVVNSGGVVAPGDSPGTLTIGGNYMQSTGGELDILFSDVTDFDVLNIAGNALLDGTLKIAVDSTFHPVFGEQFTILFANSISGDFSKFISPYFDGMQFTESVVGDEVILQVANAPEPAAWLLIAGGLLGVGWRKRHLSA